MIAGQKVWSLRADVHVLDHDGGLVDACCIATLAALRHYRIPDSSVHGGELTVYSTEERDPGTVPSIPEIFIRKRLILANVPVPLALFHHPLCSTQHYFFSGETVLVDATLIEQQCSEGEVVVTANAQGEVCLIQKGGGGEVDAFALLQCVNIAVRKIRELLKIVDKALELDAERRDKGGISNELRAENER